MKTWQLTLLGAVLLATAGCRTDPRITMLERDNFRKEQEIWRLRWRIEDLQDVLDSGDSDQRRSDDSNKPDAAASRNHAPRRQSEPAEPGFNPPSVEMPSRPSENVPDEFKMPTERRPAESRGGGDKHTSDQAAPNGPSLDGLGFNLDDSRQVASIALDRRLTGGISTGDATGDQGLLVVVKPRDSAGQPIDAPADISLVVYDPALRDESGHAALVARWEFTAAETAALLRRAGSERAIHLAAGWPSDLPQHSRLHVFVRYVTADGRKLQADRPIEVALRSDQPTRQSRTAADSPQPLARRDSPSGISRPEWSPERR